MDVSVHQAEHEDLAALCNLVAQDWTNEAGRAFYTRQGYVSRSGYDLLEKSL